jgi:hypothetical protein
MCECWVVGSTTTTTTQPSDEGLQSSGENAVISFESNQSIDFFEKLRFALHFRFQSRRGLISTVGNK